MSPPCGLKILEDHGIAFGQAEKMGFIERYKSIVLLSCDMKNALQNYYDRINNAPLWWYNKASDLHASAGALWLTITGDNDDNFISKLGLRDGFSMDVACWPVYEMLFGMSIELIFKAIFVVSNLKLPHTHNLIELAKKLNIELSDKEEKVLKLLTDAIIWGGRYPVPKQVDLLEEHFERVSKELFSTKKIGVIR